MAVSLIVKSKNNPNPHQLIDNKYGTTIQWVLFNYTYCEVLVPIYKKDEPYKHAIIHKGQILELA